IVSVTVGISMEHERSMKKFTIAPARFAGGFLLAFLLSSTAFMPVACGGSSGPGSDSTVLTATSEKQIGPSSNNAAAFVLKRHSLRQHSSPLHRVGGPGFTSGFTTAVRISNETATTLSVGERRFARPPTRAPPYV
ncbi:MAG TPA: hypothetical protein VIV66_13180, partial [Pyrinomonadaceae bacterium]